MLLKKNPHTSLSPIWLCKLQKGCTRLATASDKVYQLLAHDRCFFPGTPASSTTKTGRHDITEILLKVALKTNNQSMKSINLYTSFFILLYARPIYSYIPVLHSLICQSCILLHALLYKFITVLHTILCLSFILIHAGPTYSDMQVFYTRICQSYYYVSCLGTTTWTMFTF